MSKINFIKKINEETKEKLSLLQGANLLSIGVEKGRLILGEHIRLESGGDLFCWISASQHRYYVLSMDFKSPLLVQAPSALLFDINITEVEQDYIQKNNKNLAIELEAEGAIAAFRVFWHRHHEAYPAAEAIKSFGPLLSNTEVPQDVHVSWDFPVWFAMTFANGSHLVIERGDALGSFTLHKLSSQQFEYLKRVLFENYEDAIEVEQIF